MSITETVWKLEPHTAKKHEILRRYFQAWLPILTHGNSRFLYIDAFAGPGEYSKGEDGSPLVILKAARDHNALKSVSELRCLFVEKEPDRYAHLVEVLERVKATLPSNVKFEPLEGSFDDHLTYIFTRVAEHRNRHAPTLAFVDPFGFSHTPFTTIADFMAYPKCEVLVNFMYEEINRFLSLPQLASHFDSEFGTPDWRQALEISDPVERLMFIHDLYLRQLETVANYVRAFLMVSQSNIPKYFLFFATNNLSGLEAMKKAMWKVDPSGEFLFSDFTDAAAQRVLFAAEPDYDLLKNILTEQFHHTEVEITVLGDWVVEKTPFLRTHFKTKILAPMEKTGRLAIVEEKQGRKPGTYPEGTVVKFL